MTTHLPTLTTEIYCLRVLEARSPKLALLGPHQRVRRAVLPLKTLERILLCLLQPLGAAGIPALASTSTSPSPCVCLLFSMHLTSLCLFMHIEDLGPSPHLKRPNLTTPARPNLLPPYQVTFSGSRKQDIFDIFGWPPFSLRCQTTL